MAQARTEIFHYKGWAIHPDGHITSEDGVWVMCGPRLLIDAMDFIDHHIPAMPDSVRQLGEKVN